jgi:hypothetical protein
MSVKIGCRQLLAVLGDAASSWPLAARAQLGGRVRRIGVRMASDENDPRSETIVSAFTQALAALAWTGRNVRMDHRWGGGDTNRNERSRRSWSACTPTS